MLVLRSLAFNLAFYLNLLVWLVICIPTLVMPSRAVLSVATAWGRSNLWLMRILVGTRVEFRRLDRIPPGGLLVAAKHQSFWETFALLSLFEAPTFVLKRELTWLPIFGPLLVKAGMIPVDRGKGTSALVGMTRRAAQAVRDGRQILIFPEGTRRAPGAEPAYKFGVAHLYRSLDVPCLPVALNSGIFWPRRQFLRRPGTIVVEILEPIPPGDSRDEFLALLTDRIETASDRLIGEAMVSVRESS
ncbi:MAG TPA: lysophospholipid acyltransferase family protein [Enterovirga sp.]|jgi:1-acyl-sn-glycerol-3-phosphate acyltransferase|nr:lysophospholipid acyltransferase family protein [Enterovirga sp.]